MRKLASTVKGMLSSDFITRMEAELEQALIRADGLKRYINNNKGKKDIALEEKQLYSMKLYISILADRLRKVKDETNKTRAKDM